MPRPPRNAVAVCCACAFLWLPSPAAAQKDVFVRGMAQLQAALAGTYGSEGPQIAPAIDAMARGLAEWDRSIAAAEARVAGSAGRATSADELRLRLELARLYTERHRAADALRQVDTARPLAANPSDLDYLKGLLLDAAGKRDAAAEAFRLAWDRDRDDPINAYSMLQTGMPSPDDAQRALAVLSRTYQRLPAGTGDRAAARFLTVGPFDGPDDLFAVPHAAYAEAYRLLATGELESAIARFRESARADPLVADPAAKTPMMVRAGEALKARRLAEARGHLDAALALAPSSSEARRVRGLVEWLDGHDAAGIRHLEDAVRANPQDERARLALARIFAQAGRDAEAERTLHDTLRAIPGSLLARWWLAADYERLSRIADARRELESTGGLAAVTSPGMLYAFTGRLLRYAGDSAAAVEPLMRRVKARPNDPEAHLDLAIAYLDQDLLDEAFRELVATLLIAPETGRAYAAIGRIHLARGRPADAASALERGLALTPGDFESRYALAMALKQLGRGDEAARHLEAFRIGQQQATEARRTQMARDVLREAAKLTDTAAASGPEGAAR